MSNSVINCVAGPMAPPGPVHRTGRWRQLIELGLDQRNQGGSRRISRGSLVQGLELRLARQQQASLI